MKVELKSELQFWCFHQEILSVTSAPRFKQRQTYVPSPAQPTLKNAFHGDKTHYKDMFLKLDNDLVFFTLPSLMKAAKSLNKCLIISITRTVFFVLFFPKWNAAINFWEPSERGVGFPCDCLTLRLNKVLGPKKITCLPVWLRYLARKCRLQEQPGTVLNNSGLDSCYFCGLRLN